MQAITIAQMPAELAAAWQQAAAAVIEAALPADPESPDTWDAFAELLPHAQAALADDSGSMWKIASYLGNSGNYPAARDLQQRLLQAQVRVSGPEHPDTLAARGKLAYWNGQAGDAAGARDQLAALLPVSERVSGTEHPQTLSDLFNLAWWTGAAGDAAGAREQYAVLLPTQKRVMGAEHPYTLAARARLAYWTGAAGDAAGARDQYAALLPVMDRGGHNDLSRPRSRRSGRCHTGGFGPGAGPVAATQRWCSLPATGDGLHGVAGCGEAAPHAGDPPVGGPSQIVGRSAVRAAGSRPRPGGELIEGDPALAVTAITGAREAAMPGDRKGCGSAPDLRKTCL